LYVILFAAEIPEKVADVHEVSLVAEKETQVLNKGRAAFIAAILGFPDTCKAIGKAGFTGIEIAPFLFGLEVFLGKFLPADAAVLLARECLEVVGELFRLLGRQLAKILRGTSAADIPIEQPSKFELVVNLKTAKEIGVEIPANFVLRADKVIE
jgi:hypothetical protein